MVIITIKVSVHMTYNVTSDMRVFISGCYRHGSLWGRAIDFVLMPSFTWTRALIRQITRVGKRIKTRWIDYGSNNKRPG